MRQVLALATEALLEIFGGNKTSIVDVEMMESEEHVVLGDGPTPIDCHSQELCVIDLAIVVEVHP